METCNYKEILLWITLSILISPFILMNVCCAISNDLVEPKEDTLFMNGQLKLEIELDKQIYKVEEPILIKCKISNLSQSLVNLHPILFMDLLVCLKYEDGKKVVPFGPIILLKELIRKEGIIKLEPEQSYSFVRRVDKERYLMPNKIGRYELYALYSNIIKEFEEIKLWVGELKSNVVKFEIK